MRLKDYHVKNRSVNELVYSVTQLEQMIEDTIKNNVFLVRDMPYCALCKSRGVWTDDGPVLEYHTPECLVTRYKEYLNAA